MKYIGFPRPSYPLALSLERTYFGSCKCESNIQEEETSKRKKEDHEQCTGHERKRLRLRFWPIEKDA